MLEIGNSEVTPRECVNRVKLAQALVHDPKIVLLDEPLTGCDPVARRDLVKLMQQLGNEGKAVIVSSHILHEVEAITKEIVLVYKGEVLAEGNVYRIRELIDEHPHKIEIETENTRGLARALLADNTSDDAITSMHFPDSHRLVVETRNPDRCYSRIPHVMLAAGIRITGLRSPDNNLQAVFDYLTNTRGPQGVAAAGSPVAGETNTSPTP